MARDDEFLLTPEELRLRAQRRRRIQLSILIATVVVVGVIFGARPASSGIKAWQARRHAGKAFALIAQEKWNEAKNEVTAAYQLRPNEPQAVRAVARFLTRTRQPDALGFWQELAKIDKLTSEDLRDEAAIAMIAGDSATAEDAVKTLLGNSHAGPLDWLLAAQLSIQKGAVDDAFALIDKVFAARDATEQQQFQAALLERSLGVSSAGAEDRVNDAWSRLQKLAQSKSEVGLSALVVLAQQVLTLSKDAPHPFALTTDEIRQNLESHPLVKTPHKLLALDLEEYINVRAGLADAQRPEILARALTQFKNGDASALLALATWLNGKGEYQRELDAIPPEKALQTRELFLQHLDALGALGRWSDIRDLLGNERFPLDQVVQRMYLARASSQLGQQAAADNNWQRALEAAGGDAGKLLLLGDYAEKNGKIDPPSPGYGAAGIADQAYDAAISQAPKLRMAWQGRLRIAQANRDTNKMHEILAAMLKIWPNDPAIQNDEAYTRLLLQTPEGESQKEKIEKEVQSIVDLAQELVKRNPRSLPHRTLLALARLKQNKPNEAFLLYDNIRVAANALNPSALAVHAAVLAANGRLDDAKAEAAHLKPEQLLPEERALIEEVIRGP